MPALPGEKKEHVGAALRVGYNTDASKNQGLIRDLEAAGFVDRGGKGSHRNFAHPRVTKSVTIAGKLGADAKHYQEKAVKAAIEESKR